MEAGTNELVQWVFAMVWQKNVVPTGEAKQNMIAF